MWKLYRYVCSTAIALSALGIFNGVLPRQIIGNTKWGLLAFVVSILCGSFVALFEFFFSLIEVPRLPKENQDKQVREMILEGIYEDKFLVIVGQALTIICVMGAGSGLFLLILTPAPEVAIVFSLGALAVGILMIIAFNRISSRFDTLRAEADRKVSEGTPLQRRVRKDHSSL